MFRNFSKCQKCESELVDGPDLERKAEAKGFTCEVKGIPTKICPRGCTGCYWYWLDFGVEVVDSLSPESPNIAKGKFGFFKTRQFCKNCNVELVNNSEPATFVFHQKLMKGTQLEIVVTAPSLTCPQCNSSFMPAQASSHDTYYSDLTDAVGEAITKDLIYK